MFSQAEENYLKAIFYLEFDFGSRISTNHIAKKLTTKASSVTDMLKKLAQKGLVIYEKYKGVSLSDKGRDIAVYVVRKHRLWETFLVNSLHFKWDEVHDMAEQLEHIKSEELVNRLDAFLDFPKRDPHGHSIPDKNGKMRVENTLLLHKAKINIKYKIASIKDSSAAFLQYLDSMNIAINSELIIVEKLTFDDSLLVEINNITTTFSAKVCQNLFVN